MSIILTIIVCVAAVIGFIVGLVRGFTKASAWGAAVLLSVLIVRLIANLTQSFYGRGEFVLVAAVVALLLMMLIFQLLKGLFKRQIAKAYELHDYKTYDEREENTERILNALDAGDKKEYKKNVKHKIKKKAGGWGVFNRLFGGVMVGLNTAIIFALLISIIIVVVDFAQIESLTLQFADVLQNGAWVYVGSTLVFDLIVMSLLHSCLRLGYKGGISGTLCAVVIIGLLVGSGYLSFHLAFQTEAFASLATQMINGGMGSFLESVGSTTSSFGITAETIAKLILMICLFIVLLILVIICGIFLPKLVDKFKEGKAFRVVDGVFGAIVFTVVIFAVLMLLGGALYTLNDLEFMNGLNTYMANNVVANGLYANNPLYSLGIFNSLPIRGWFGAVETTVE